MGELRYMMIRERLRHGGVFLKIRVKRESIFKCMRNLSIVTGFLSIIFILFIALVLSNVGYMLSVLISLSVAVVYLIYRITTENIE